jgi:putative PIN family toxin of toxin-antitoxin system
VFDTNVILSALKSKTGASFKLIDLIRSGVLNPAVTAPLVFEYEDVLSRVGLLPHLTPADVASFLDWFVYVSTHHEVHFLWRPFLRDPKDDMVLEAALASGAQSVVTYNISDFQGADALSVLVLTPPQLLAKINSAKLP